MSFAPKKLIFDEEVINKLLIGIEKVYKSVSSTYGIGGKLVGFESSDTIYPRFTKDGVSVARSIILPDQAENIGALLLIQAANKQVDETGDGTTLTIVLAHELIKAGIKAINAGINPTLIRDGLKSGVGLVIDKLTEQSISITPELLESVATIACNNDKLLGKLIAEAMIKVGEYGVVSQGKSKTGKTYIEYSDGYEFNNGIKYREFVNNLQKGTLELDSPLVLVADKSIAYGQDINVIAQATGKRPLIIICDEFVEDSEALHAIIAGHKEGYKICLIKTNINAPMERKYILEDIAALCGTQVYSKEWRDFTQEDFGTCEHINSGFTKTIITGAKSKALSRRIDELKISLSAIEDEYEKELAEISLAKLNNGMATIRVGGYTESEQGELLDRVDDSIKACKSAKEEGVVNGGGVALLLASKQVGGMPSIGETIVIEAIQKPIVKLLTNANKKADLVTEKIILEQAKGYDILTGETTDTTMIENNIIDPLKVIRTALINAVSVASIVLQTSVLITVDREAVKELINK